MTLDDIRASHPALGLALYAFTPGGAVTLEVHTPGGNIETYVGATEDEACRRAFLEPVVSQTPLGAGSAPALRPTQEPQQMMSAAGKAGGVAETTGGVFD